MTDHKLMPKHGERINISETDVENIIKHICKLQRNASIDLGDIISTILINDKTKMAMLPCKQCVLDVALQFRMHMQLALAFLLHYL